MNRTPLDRVEQAFFEAMVSELHRRKSGPYKKEEIPMATHFYLTEYPDGTDVTRYDKTRAISHLAEMPEYGEC